MIKILQNTFKNNFLTRVNDCDTQDICKMQISPHTDCKEKKKSVILMDKSGSLPLTRSQTQPSLIWAILLV